MTKTVNSTDMVDTLFHGLADRGLIHHGAQDASLDGRHVTVAGRRMLHFGSCSYLGLELHPRLQAGAIEATRRFGTQFSSSRSYLSLPLYDELESMLGEIFGGPTLATPSTTLGHMAALPVLIGENDAVILDQQVHHSVQTAAGLVKLAGAHVEIMRHNRMDRLEERIVALKQKHRHVWYLADGVYSMFGDLAPFDALQALMARHEQLHLYVDDAHGMSWMGHHGRGCTLTHMSLRERMVVATSLNKAFAAGGGALIFPDAELHRRVRTVGGPMIFAGPIQPPMLGAAVASARLHLSDELAPLQEKLQSTMRHCNRLLLEAGLPLVHASEAPIRYVGLGLPKTAAAMVERLMADGFFVNIAPFPAVPMKRAGVRFTLTAHHTHEDVEQLVAAFARHLPTVLDEQGTSLSEIHKAFDGLCLPVAPSLANVPQTLELTVKAASPLELQHETTIDAIDRAAWDACMADRGTFHWEGLKLLEKLFRDPARPENDWKFHYYMVRDDRGRVVLATYFTDALWKDDMLESEAISRRVEARRVDDPRFLTSRHLGMGSLLTEGNHLYLDRSGDWKGALIQLFGALDAQRERCGANGIFLRDLPEDAELDAFLSDRGFVHTAQMDSFVLEGHWPDEAAFLAGLSAGARRHQRRYTHPWNAAYAVEVLCAGGRTPSEAEWAHLHRLYLAVQQRNMGLNTFPLPAATFAEMLARPGWELLLLRPAGEPEALPVAVSAAYVGPQHYVPLVCGLDYALVRTHGLYRQLLRQVIERARALDKPRVHLGFSAEFEKRRFGAKPLRHAVYAQLKDHYHVEVLEQLRSGS